MNNYLITVKRDFEQYKLLGEKTLSQLDEQDLFWKYNTASNSIAVIINHLHGNMKSRWTDFLTTDGEKTWRKRDSEFENQFSIWARIWRPSAPHVCEHLIRSSSDVVFGLSQCL